MTPAATAEAARTAPDHAASNDFVRSYAQHHLVGSRGGLDLFRRAAATQSSDRARRELTRLAGEVAEDRAALERIVDVLGAGQAKPAQAVARIGERLARLKPNGRLVRRSPLSDVAELEAMILGVTGKRQCWMTLLDAATPGSGLDRDALDRLRERADGQLATLADLHAVAARALVSP